MKKQNTSINRTNFTGKAIRYIFDIIRFSVEEDGEVLQMIRGNIVRNKGKQKVRYEQGKTFVQRRITYYYAKSLVGLISIDKSQIAYNTKRFSAPSLLKAIIHLFQFTTNIPTLWPDKPQMIFSSPNQQQYSYIDINALILFSSWIYNYEFQQMNSKENNQDRFIDFLEKECEQQRQLEQYYERQLLELIQSVAPPQQSLTISKPSPPRNKNVRVKTQEVSFMEESVVSIKSKAISKTDKKQAKREAPSFEMEYQLLSKEIAKLIQGISNKDAVFKKTATTPKRNSSFTNKSISKPVASDFKMNLSTVSISKTERQSINHQRQQLLSELGDSTLMTSSDEVVSKLVGNLRLEEQRFVDALLYRGRMSARSKMRNYLEHLCEKNQENLFKLRQKAIDRSLSRIETNRETVRNGYTIDMKELIEAGLRGKASA